MAVSQTSVARMTLRDRVARMGSWQARERLTWRRLLPAGVVLVLGIAVTVLVLRVVHARDVAQHRDGFIQEANAVSSELQRQFGMPIEVLRSVRAFFGASEVITHEEFSRFVTDALQRYPSLSLLEWAPYVTGDDRAQFEADAQPWLPGYVITEQDEDGTFRRAAERREYYPLLFMEPSDDATALGFDLLSESRRRGLIRTVVATGEPIASGRFQLVEDTAGNWSIAAYLAVFHGASSNVDSESRIASQRGLAIAIFRLTELVERALEQHRTDRLAMRLVDEYEAGTDVLFALRWPDTVPGVDAPSYWAAAWEYGGRRWRLEFVDLEPVRFSPMEWLVLLGGLLVTLLATIVVAASNVVFQLRKEVEEAKRLGQYTLVRRLGHGGMGVVYAARHAFLRRPTAIKVLQNSEDGVSTARFEREVQLTARLTHPNTIAIYDYGRTDEGEFYYAMELLDGLSFEALVRQFGPVPPGRVVHLLRQVLGALAEAHSVGLIHRDIKPANLMLSTRGGIPDFVKVLDFGLVKETHAETDPGLTQTRVILGTPQYLSPEAIIGEDPVDGRSDLYALAAVAYYLLTGQPVFAGPSVVQVCFQHCNEAPVPPSKRSTQPIPASLDAVILKALRKIPAERYASAQEFIDALDALNDVPPWTSTDARQWWREWRSEHPALESLLDDRLLRQAAARPLPDGLTPPRQIRGGHDDAGMS